MTTKNDLVASAEKLKADILDFSQKRELGPMGTENGVPTGLYLTLVNGEEGVAGHALRFIDEAMTYVDQLQGSSTGGLTPASEDE